MTNFHSGQLKSGAWLLEASGLTASKWFTAYDPSALTGVPEDEKHRQDDGQDQQITSSRWFLADDDDPDRDDKPQGPAPTGQPTTTVAPNSTNTTQYGPNGATATDPHATPAAEAHPGAHIGPGAWNNWMGAGGGGGGYSGGSSGGAVSSGGSSTGGPASVIPGPGGAVPLIQKSDGTWGSSNPAWQHLIDRESGGRNIIQSPSTHDVNTGGNEGFGLFQITPGTWSSHGGQGSVYNSTPQQQAEVAGNIIKSNPSGSDWGAGLSGRENASALGAGLSPLPGSPGV